MNTSEIRALKGKQKIVMLTAYDYQIARILESINIDMILVGDSLGMVFQGNPNTKKVTMDAMLYHTEAVAKGATNTLIVADMPIHSYDSPEQALTNAKQLCKAGAHAVKIEGNQTEVIQMLLKHDIPVMGHLGLLPQSAEKFRVQGKTPEQADQIWRDALELDKRGVFSLVLECIPEWLARKITHDIKTPTIGIGAGKHCDGQVLVVTELLGLVDNDHLPKFVKKFASLNEIISQAVMEFANEVRSGKYPDKQHTYH
ncbi:MAG: 3-methyl-2-oxobutanoate hydroxymethyltransferase [Candidatus Thorarchaeota archaeon]